MLVWLSGGLPLQTANMASVASVSESQRRQLKESNIVIHGVPEGVDEAGVRALFRGGEGLPHVAEQIVGTRRLGRLRAPTRRSRPVLVEFQTPGARRAAFGYSRILKPFRLDEDLTPAQLAARRSQYSLQWFEGTLC